MIDGAPANDGPRPVEVVLFGASGYSGLEILRLLSRHPSAKVVAASSDGMKGQPVKARVPEWPDGLLFSGHDAVLSAARAGQIALLATPAKTSAELAAALLLRGLRVIDLSGAHRLLDPASYPEWYGFSHPHPELLAEAVYGLFEIWPPMAQARLVANPGCYATAAILAAGPLLSAGLLAEGAPLVIDGKSGVTGAGRALEEKFLFAEVAESVRPYRIGRHQHTPEIERALSRIAGRAVAVSFTAHLIPMRRGLLASVYAPAKPGVVQADVDAALRRAYAEHAFVRVLTDRPPESGYVSYTNFAEVSASLDPRTRLVLGFGAIDNLVKGAAGQAIQNLNALAGLDPRTGL